MKFIRFLNCLINVYFRFSTPMFSQWSKVIRHSLWRCSRSKRNMFYIWRRLISGICYLNERCNTGQLLEILPFKTFIFNALSDLMWNGYSRTNVMTRLGKRILLVYFPAWLLILYLCFQTGIYQNILSIFMLNGTPSENRW